MHTLCAPDMAVDWSRPWLAPYRELGQPLSHRVAQGDGVVPALNSLAERRRPMLAAGALRFVGAAELPPSQAYESFIARTACVPTRAKLHDLFNALVWLTFPRLKCRLNELHAEQIAREGVGPARGPARDALTLFDENAALLQAPPVLAGALRARDWQALFVTHRGAWCDARVTLFGHALLDKLVTPRKNITAHAWLVPEAVDAQAYMLERLTPEWLTARSWLPLPVLGVPGWWAANERADFYDDAGVFRPARG